MWLLRINTFSMKMLTFFLVSCFHNTPMECSLCRGEKGRRVEEEGGTRDKARTTDTETVMGKEGMNGSPSSQTAARTLSLSLRVLVLSRQQSDRRWMGGTLA
jgi:hypothetical protein